MLAKLLATGIGLGSLAFYIAAFFFPEVHRRHDFFWSGVGLFYALVLWVCAGQFTGALLISQLASGSLVVWLGWQTLRLRRARTPVLLQTPATADAWRGFRQEMAELFDSLVSLTPLDRWLPSLAERGVAQSAEATEGSIRAASLRKVGYEFVDDIEIQEPLPPPHQAPPNPSGNINSRQASAPDSRPAIASTQPRPVAPVRKPTGILQTGLILKDWVLDVAKSMRSKPARPVIEIPPRDSQPGSSQTAQTSEPERADSKMDTGSKQDEANWPDDQSESAHSDESAVTSAERSRPDSAASSSDDDS